MTDVVIDTAVDETFINGFKPGYLDVFVKYLAKKYDWTDSFTRLVVRDALRFFVVCAIPVPDQHTDQAIVMVSSPVVDEVVDAIMLDTPLLAWLEKNLTHGRIVHVPSYAHGVTSSAVNNARYELTVSMMLAAGWDLDRETIWPSRLPDGYWPCSGGNDLDDCHVCVTP